ncbi:MAG: twin-arginine translocase TatA/TatE family subunit [Oligoflexia bacterium]|nr:twin-arginine translocase TatA/TatE family subunit [Oligoflexia bacterium]
MFGVSLPELLVIFTVLLLLFGPDKLPELAKTLGKLTGEFRRASDGLRREFYNSVYNPAELAKNRIDSELRELRSISSRELAQAKPNETLQTGPHESASPKQN